ncbi:hypothetical protein I350_07211 [Cryptococcus amylolentus CBS 6273]|uniref:GH18 domain-containing protein n=1 Tax=Cryptococcus amylolentus CBS 6273 TaxID=1296118 RepID=A0A1E3JDZ0_9TREE|nr:hypothetical protein I350_07211 [Cryptococcus amylolentus CBS 6273]
MVSSPAVFVLSLLLASQSAFAAKATAPPGRHRHPRGFRQALEERELDERLLPITATTTIVVPMTATHTVWVNPTGGQAVFGDGGDDEDSSSSSVVSSASESSVSSSYSESSTEPTASASSASLSSSESLSSASETLSASSSLSQSSSASAFVGAATNSSSIAEPTASSSSSLSPSASATETITSSSIEPSSTQASTNSSSSYQESSSSSASAPNSTVLSEAESSATETASSSAFVTASESESTGAPSANETSSSSTISEEQSATLTDSSSSSALPTESASQSANSSSGVVLAGASNSSTAFEPSATLSEVLNSSASASETASASNSSLEATASATESATSSSSGWWWWPTASSSASASETNSTSASASQTESASESLSTSEINSTSATVSQTQSPSETLSSNVSSTATESATDSWSESISSTPTASATQSNSSATNASSTASSSSSASSSTSTLGTNLMLGYYPDWATNITPEDVDWDRFDILDFAFAVPDSAGGLTWDDDSATETLTSLVTYAHKAGKRVKLSVGGWTGSAYFSTLTASDSLRATFVSNIVDLYDEYDLDGIDIDWEYPGTDGADGNAVSSDDSANFLTFLTDLRSALPSGAIITTATQVWPFADTDGNPMTDVSAFAKVIDWILIMNYDVWGSSTTPGPNAPLSDGCNNSTQPLANAYAAVSSWTSAGMPADQITLGVPAYGYLQDSTATSLIQRRSVDTTQSLPHRRHAMSLKNKHRKRASDVTVTNEDGGTSDGQVMWYSLLSQGALTLEDGSYVGDGGFTRHWDSCSSTPWLKSSSSGQIITYDDPESMNLKAQFAAQAGLRGCNVFSIDGDYTGSSWPLTDSVRSGMGL